MILIIFLQYLLLIPAKIILDSQQPLVADCLALISETHFQIGHTVSYQTNDYTSQIQNKFLIATTEASQVLIETKTCNLIFEYDAMLNETLTLLASDLITFNSRGKYVVIATNQSELKAIVDILWHFRLYKSLILVQEQSKVNLYEMKFSKCGDRIEAVKVDSCLNYKNHKLFQPDMKKQFSNCTLYVITSRAYPWIEYENNRPTGLFIKAMNLFAEKNGFVLEYRPENPVYADELQESYSYETAHDHVESGYADFFVTLGNNIPYLYFDCSFTLHDTSINLIVSKPEKMPYWKSGLKIFSLLNWIIIILVFVITNVAFLVTAKNTDTDSNFRDTSRNFLYSFAVLIGFPSHASPKGDMLKVIFLHFIFFCFFVTVVIQAKLYSVFTDPLYENEITSLEMLIESGMPIVFQDGLGVLFLYGGPTYRYIFDHYTSTSIPFGQNVVEWMKKKNFATACDTGSFIMHPSLKKMVNVFDVFKFQSVMYMKKHHALFECFHWEMKKIVEHGFMEKLVSDVTWSYDLKDEFRVLPKYDVRFSLQHLRAVFFITAEGYVLAMLVFLCEIFWSKFKGFRRRDRV